MQNMKKVKAIDNQTILDFALANYGTAEAVTEIMQLNPLIENDPAAMVEAGIAPGDFYFDIKLLPGQEITIDDDSRLIRKAALKEITTEVTTYTTKAWQERLMK